MLTIYTICYNEQLVLPHFVKWYRARFPNCKIVVYDNESTDNTEFIAYDLACGVVSYSTDNKLSDSAYLTIKNNAWKLADTDWVMVVDCDEFVDVNESDLIEFQNSKKTIISATGYNMCNVEGLTELADIKHGVRAEQYDKSILFNKNYITEINYDAGCHTCSPKGVVNYAKGLVNLYHMHLINEQALVDKYLRNADRMSEENKKNKWGHHYLQSEEIVRANYKHGLELAKLIR
jgi:glycosyltransferase involved in cell wall biosynthesis